MSPRSRYLWRPGRESWEQAVFFLPDDPDSWRARRISRSGDRISIDLCRDAGGGTEYCQVVSRDWGETWELEESYR